jgi:hypothetical protein
MANANVVSGIVNALFIAIPILFIIGTWWIARRLIENVQIKYSYNTLGKLNLILAGIVVLLLIFAAFNTDTPDWMVTYLALSISLIVVLLIKNAVKTNIGIGLLLIPIQLFTGFFFVVGILLIISWLSSLGEKRRRSSY